MSAAREQEIRRRLDSAFTLTELLIKDQSHLHAGHAGAADGRGHFDVRLVSEDFAGMSRVQRHQSVYLALGDLLESDIHAVRINAVTPEELHVTGRNT